MKPKQLFHKQKEEYLKGKFEEVIRLAKQAKVKQPDPENWEKAKRQLEDMNFPQDTDPDWKEVSDKEYHHLKRRQHSLNTYKKWFQLLGYEVEAKYNYCRECKKTRNAVLTIYNNQKGVMYEKWFVWHGQDVEGQDLVEIAKRMFAMLVLLILS